MSYDFVKNHRNIESADIRWGALVESPLLCTQVRKHSVQKQMSYALVLSATRVVCRLY
jgi:hypothetical protein